MSDTKRSSETPEEIEIDLRQLFKTLRKRSRLIIIITVLTTLTAGLISYYYLRPVYQAQTLLMVTVASEKLQDEPDQWVTQEGLKNDKSQIPVLTMNTYLGQLTSEVVMKRIITSLGLSNQTVESLADKINATIVTDSNLIEVKVNDPDPVLAANIANTLSKEYLKLMQEFMFSSVVVISPANVPTNPVSPNIPLNTAIAFILGLILSILLAFLLEYMDDTLKTTEDINRELELPVLGLIPTRTKNNTRQGNYGGSI